MTTMIDTGWRWLRRLPSLCCFGAFLALWRPLNALSAALGHQSPPGRWRWLTLPFVPFASLALLLLVAADRLDRLLVPESYRTLGPDDEVVPFP